MDKRLSAVYACLAVGLAMVTAVSVAMTIFNLIDDPMLAVIFSGAAVFLDIFKYLGWPLAIRLISQQRLLNAGAMVICVSTLGMVSGWSTYDRLMNSIEISHARQSALAGGRIDHLNALIKKDSDFLEALGNSEKQLDRTSSDLRAKGMVTKAQELEYATFERIDNQRLAAMQRIESNSQEITEIRSSIAKAASTPLVLAALLCVGFALALELVPALLLAILQSNHDEMGRTPDTLHGSKELEALELTYEKKTKKASMPSNNHLVDALLKKISSLPGNSKIKVKDFSVEHRVGNLKSCAAFKAVEELGAIQKTPHGYLTTTKQ